MAIDHYPALPRKIPRNQMEQRISARFVLRNRLRSA
jgi:hypothetical protein